MDRVRRLVFGIEIIQRRHGVTRLRQRVLVLAIGALIFGGLACLSGAAPASAQSPTVGPNVGFPFSQQFPYVGPANVAGQGYAAGVAYPTLTQTPNLFPLAAYQPGATTNVIPNPAQVVSSFTGLTTKIVGAQTNGSVCKDKSGGQIWVPAGAPPDPALSC
jgi:hypothetical protein